MIFIMKLQKKKYKNWIIIENIENEKNDNKSVLEILNNDINLIENYKLIEKYFPDDNTKEDCPNLIKKKLKNSIHLLIYHLIRFYRYINILKKVMITI